MAIKTLENVTVSDAYLALMADRGVEYLFAAQRRVRCRYERGRRLTEVAARLEYDVETDLGHAKKLL
jgi:hypothetical protein